MTKEENNKISEMVETLDKITFTDFIRNVMDHIYEQGKKDAYKWIPVSERLPEQTGEYIATVENQGFYFTDKFAYEPTVNGGWYDPEAPNQTSVDWNKFIIAWMPLPEPYKGGEE